MEQATINRLINFYTQLSNHTPQSCIKFNYQKNNVSVSLYFDAFDIKQLSLILVLSFNNEYYFKPLDLINNGKKSEYLNDIPYNILNQIIDNSSLIGFFDDMEGHLNTDTPTSRSYNDPTDDFHNARNNNVNGAQPQFWYTVRRTKMTDETLQRIADTGVIAVNVLREIQDLGYTLIRTSDPAKRKELTLILETISIKL